MVTEQERTVSELVHKHAQQREISDWPEVARLQYGELWLLALDLETALRATALCQAAKK